MKVGDLVTWIANPGDPVALGMVVPYPVQEHEDRVSRGIIPADYQDLVKIAWFDGTTLVLKKKYRQLSLLSEKIEGLGENLEQPELA